MNIECSPEVARPFLGFPDVAPMQEEFLPEYHDPMHLGMGKLASEALMIFWISLTGCSWLEMQKTFWSQFAGSSPKE
tara:strand:- start:828 stop:1058 length:231 start_codon:yes stop_codon:yes gene_type:complete